MASIEDIEELKKRGLDPEYFTIYNPSCLSPAEKYQYLLALCPEEQVKRINSHLKTCQECQQDLYKNEKAFKEVAVELERVKGVLFNE